MDTYLRFKTLPSKLLLRELCPNRLLYSALDLLVSLFVYNIYDLCFLVLYIVKKMLIFFKMMFNNNVLGSYPSFAGVFLGGNSFWRTQMMMPQISPLSLSPFNKILLEETICCSLETPSHFTGFL